MNYRMLRLISFVSMALIGTTSFAQTSNHRPGDARDGAGDAISTGDRNVFMGDSAGNKTNTGSQNVFIGHDAGLDNTSGSDFFFLGRSIE